MTEKKQMRDFRAGFTLTIVAVEHTALSMTTLFRSEGSKSAKFSYFMPKF